MTDDLKGARTYDAVNPRGLAAKREYVRDLALRADAQSLALLVECLCDESWYTRDLAEQAFLGLDPPRGDLLVPLIDQGLWYTRTTVSRILGLLGYRPAVPGLLQLVQDHNATVVAAAREALIEIGLRGGAMRLAHALHRATPDERRQRLDEIGASHHALRDRLDRMMRNEELMTIANPDGYGDDSAVVRASEEGVEWEVLTGPATPGAKAAPSVSPPPETSRSGSPPEPTQAAPLAPPASKPLVDESNPLPLSFAPEETERDDA